MALAPNGWLFYLLLEVGATGIVRNQEVVLLCAVVSVEFSCFFACLFLFLCFVVRAFGVVCAEGKAFYVGRGVFDHLFV